MPQNLKKKRGKPHKMGVGACICQLLTHTASLLGVKLPQNGAIGPIMRLKEHLWWIVGGPNRLLSKY